MLERGNKNVDTSKVQSLNNTSSNEIESLDLSNEIEPKESKGLIDSIGDGLNDMISANNAGVDAILIDRINAFKEDDRYLKISNLWEIMK